MSSPRGPDTPPTPEESTNLGGRVVDVFRRERDDAVEELNKVKNDLSAVKKMLKELHEHQSEMEAKEKEKKDKKKSGSKKKKKKDTGDTLNISPTPALSPSAQLLLSLATPAIDHPKIPGLDPESDSKEFYAAIAERFPNMKISHVLEAEKKFLKADKNRDGVIDRDELDRILIVGVTVFTPGKVEEILKEIDIDESGTIDFLEAMSVMDKLMGNRRTNLPDQIKQNQTKICAIQ